MKVGGLKDLSQKAARVTVLLRAGWRLTYRYMYSFASLF